MKLLLRRTLQGSAQDWTFLYYRREVAQWFKRIFVALLVMANR